MFVSKSSQQALQTTLQAYCAFFVGHKSSTLSFEVRDKDHIGADFIGQILVLTSPANMSKCVKNIS